jgi:hypothetical protein
VRLYNIKYNDVYVKAAYMLFNEITFTPIRKKMKHLTEEEKDFVLSFFPDAEVKIFDVVENNSLSLS